MGKPGKEKNASTGPPTRGRGRGRGGGGGGGRGRGAARGTGRGAKAGPSSRAPEVDWGADAPKPRTWDKDAGMYSMDSMCAKD
jgi:hypothetical protein